MGTPRGDEGGAETSELRNADLVVIATDHDAFDWGLVASGANHIVDTRHRLPNNETIESL